MFISCFNSNMVRLKEYKERFNISILMFQFQYGSIKSVFKYQELSCPCLFQFQYGSIKRRGYVVYFFTLT